MQVKFLKISEKFRSSDINFSQFAFKCVFELSGKHTSDIRRNRIPLPDSCVGLKNEPIRCFNGKCLTLVVERLTQANI